VAEIWDRFLAKLWWNQPYSRYEGSIIYDILDGVANERDAVPAGEAPRLIVSTPGVAEEKCQHWQQQE
jgi:hypothetical protein